MKKTTASLLAGMTALTFTAVTASAQLGNLMLETWDSAPLGDIHPTTGSGYTGAWSSVGFNAVWPGGHEQVQPVNSLAEIRTDTDNIFGRGTSNQVLFLGAAAGLSFNFQMPAGIEVATLSYEISVTGYHPVGTSRFTNRFFTADGTVINHGLQPVGNAGQFRMRNESDRFDLDTLYRFEVVTNNSADTITVNAPDGAVSLDSAMTGVWVNGELSTIYNFDRGAGVVTGDLTRFSMETFTNNTWSAYIDQIAITEGAYVIPEPSTYALIFGGLALSGALFTRRRRERAQH